MLEKTNNNERLNRFNKKCQANIIIKNSIAIELLIFEYQIADNVNWTWQQNAPYLTKYYFNKSNSLETNLSLTMRYLFKRDNNLLENVSKLIRNL